jgi:hypothetical protein
MKIETKYNIGDVVWFYSGFTPTKAIVRVVKTENNKVSNDIIYEVETEDWGGSLTPVRLFERFIFPTKEELLKSL